MIHGVHPPGAHHIGQVLLVTHRAQNRQQLHCQRFAPDALLKLGEDAVQVEFTVVEQQQGLGLQPNDLPAQLGADRAARAGHQHGTLLVAAPKQFILRRHRVAAQQVGNVDILDVIDLDPATGQVGKRRHTAHMQRVRFEEGEDLFAPRT
ncbi:hypothetical protein D3C81_1380440 [compost metagenome]